MSDFDEAAEATETQRDAAEKVMDVAKVPGGDAMGLLNAGATTNKGIGEIEKGDTAAGVVDTGMGAAGVVDKGASIVKEVAEAAGSEGVAGGAGKVAGVAGTIAGGLQIGKGIGEVATDDGYGGKTLDGIHDMLAGTASTVGSAGGASPAGMVAKAFGAGFSVGDMIAPTVFGDMKNTGTHYENADQEFHASTGNRAIDWIAGTGDYTNGRW